MDEDFSRYYDLEDYLFGKVSPKFKKEGQLSAFDFFCIIIWKANRAKSKIYNKLRSKGMELCQSKNIETIEGFEKGALRHSKPQQNPLGDSHECLYYELPAAVNTCSFMLP